MCTVSIIRIDARGGYSLIFNRDEQHSRARAVPPMIAASDAAWGEPRLCVYPIDPVSRGTWIGTNVHGLTACLLNSTRTAPASSPSRLIKSRGEIVPRLLALTSVAEALPVALSLNPGDYPAFRVVLADRSRVAVIRSDAALLSCDEMHTGLEPLMWGSSGLGDELAEPRRRELFMKSVPRSADSRGAQAAFHTHRWPEAMHVSVQMSRADARTVSRTRVEFNESGLRMEYEEIDEAGLSSIPAPPLWLPLNSPGVSL